MLNYIIVICVLLQVLRTECLFSGESCLVEGESGNCIPLKDCQEVLNMVTKAGRPMPLYIRRKLQQLTCGFELNESMVCCTSKSIVTDKPSCADPSENTEFTLPSASWTSSDSSRDFGFPTLPPWKPTQHRPNLEPGITTSSPWPNRHDKDDSDNVISFDENPTKKPFTKQPEYKKEPQEVNEHRNLRLLPQNNCGTIEEDRIWGGNRTRLFEMPWMVLLSYDSGHQGQKLSCGGTLINEWYVLTAAHCVSFLGPTLRLDAVILGEYDVRQDPDCEMSDGQQYCAPSMKNVSIASVIPHSGYTPQKLVNDIALIRLAEPADFTKENMKPICLPITRDLQTENIDGNNGVVAGWGVTEDGLQSPVLLSVDLPILKKSECQKIFNGSLIIADTQLCAGGIRDKDSCGGDSGGPIMFPGRLLNHGVRYIQRGIVSFGPKRCAIGGVPGVYTNVAYYMKWILDNMRS